MSAEEVASRKLQDVAELPDHVNVVVSVADLRKVCSELIYRDAVVLSKDGDETDLSAEPPGPSGDDFDEPEETTEEATDDTSEEPEPSGDDFNEPEETTEESADQTAEEPPVSL